MSAGDTLYLKIGKNVVVTDRRVTLGDVAKMECTDQAAPVSYTHLDVYKRQSGNHRLRYRMY